jgi:agmatine deiminase
MEYLEHHDFFLHSSSILKTVRFVRLWESTANSGRFALPKRSFESSCLEKSGVTSMRSLLHFAVIGIALVLPTVTDANDYLPNNTNNRYSFVNSKSGQTVSSQIEQEYGQWRLWSNIGGFGSTWVYTATGTDYFWFWTGQTYELVGDLGGNNGVGKNVQLGGCNNGDAFVANRGTLTVPAGIFNDVTHLQFDSSCSDAGVTGVWFAKGIGVVQWTEQNIAGEQTFQLASAQVDGRLFPTVSTSPTPPATSQRAVAASEHETMETIMWGANDTYLVIPTYRDAFTALASAGVKVQVIVSSQSVASELRYELSSRNVSLSNVEILVASLDSVWMRDYGPIILKRGNGERVVADPDYYYNRQNDNAFPRAYAGYRGWDYVKVNMSYEGGNFATDGKGIAVTSTGVLRFNRDMSQSSIEQEFAKMGCDQVQFVEPLVDEGTTHIDMLARVMDDRNALVSRYPTSHRQARVVDAAAQAFQRLGYNVTRVDADYQYDEYASYSNSVLANGTALIPSYGSSKDQLALDAYTRLGFKAVAIDSKLIIKYSGATHCLSMQIPAGR